MGETILKLQPDRDLQCYFLHPSAIAAMSNASATGFVLSGSWRQQFDWAVVEWNRDNVFEHPLLRKLPDGDLSGLHLSYEEQRINCIPIDSDLYPTVDWPVLRIWADDGTGEQIYKVPLASYKTAVVGAYNCAEAEITLTGVPTQGDYVGFAFLSEHYPYQFYANDSLEAAVLELAKGVNAYSPTMRAAATGTTIRLTFVGNAQTAAESTTGANGNRIGLYTYSSGSQTAQWDVPWKQFSGGTSPTKWRIDLPFNSLRDVDGRLVPARAVRKMRWTYSADLQTGAFERTEFQVGISNWDVTGTSLLYEVAGPDTRRIEDRDKSLNYTGSWTKSAGNFSGGTIQFTTVPGSGVQLAYVNNATHKLFLGTRYTYNAPIISISIDGGTATSANLNIPGEDILARAYLGELGPGNHTVTVHHAGESGQYFFFDFFELTIARLSLPLVPQEARLTLSTDWDTDHSIALPPERTAWLINRLGFGGRVNHYAGALWFYELTRTGHRYASGTITFTGTPDANAITTVRIGRTGEASALSTAITHLNLIGDTAESLAKAFELEINRGYTAIRAEASGATLTIYAREMGVAGNTITVAVDGSTNNLSLSTSGPTLSGGTDGDWHVDLNAAPRLNRAARDWNRGFFQALKLYGLDATAAFSMELQHGDPSPEVGIAQRYPSQAAVMVNTPALQTNFSPQSVRFWSQVYLDMAGLQSDAGMVPFLQFGEVQWWYFPDDGSGMPFYDSFTAETFRLKYGRDMTVITSNVIDPSNLSDESEFLPGIIGSFTSQIMAFVRSAIPECRFEVLYPTDVNSTPLNRLINYPKADWTPAILNCLKTESFTYTYGRNLDLSRSTIDAGASLGFLPSRRSHLVGISDASTAWLKEARMAQGRGFESVVLFALDQFCLIGYPAPLSRGARRSFRAG